MRITKKNPTGVVRCLFLLLSQKAIEQTNNETHKPGHCKKKAKVKGNKYTDRFTSQTRCNSLGRKVSYSQTE